MNKQRVEYLRKHIALWILQHYDHYPYTPAKPMLPYKTTPVQFSRTADVNELRSSLPIFKNECDIMESIISNEITIIVGSTGSGKTTQIPQFIVEAGFGQKQSMNPGRVVITQPRRIAAICSGARLRYELGDEGLVSIKTRFESSISMSSLLDVVTEGILVREFLECPLLDEYSVIIIDEVHERSYNCDLLISLICRLLQIRNKPDSRNPLRLILMSASMQDDIIEFVREFASTNVTHVEGVSFPINIYYNKSNCSDYINSAVRKIKKIRHRLPEGKILVFFPSKADLFECSQLLSGLSGVNIICIHGSMEYSHQQEIFSPNRKGTDVILATNVAETSITIPDVKYVVDTGLVKRKTYDSSQSQITYQVGWTSKASAQQRAGRTGRTNVGYCYRLYSPATFTEFSEHESPEIYSIRLDSHIILCLRLGICTPQNFQMPSHPENENFKTAMTRLQSLKIISEDSLLKKEYEVLCDFPLPPECSILILIASFRDASRNVLSLVALVAVLMSIECIISDSKILSSLYKEYFKGDLIFEAYIVHCVKKKSLAENFRCALTEKLISEVCKVYSQLSKIIHDLMDCQIDQIQDITFDKKSCTEALKIVHSKSIQIAARCEHPDSKGRSAYICSTLQLSASISPASMLARKSPRIVSYRNCIQTKRGKYILTRISEIS